MTVATPLNALVLAGARSTGDPLCVAEGVASKAIIDIAGQPMLSHVMTALSGAGAHAPIWVLGGQGEDLSRATGGVAFQSLPATGDGPAGSLVEALTGPVPLPLLVTTADHPLLTPEMITHFVHAARESDADICIGFATRSTIEAEYPETRRTYLPIGEKNLSGCNLFYLKNDNALQVLRFWRGVEQHRKHPWRIARALGLGFLLRLFLRRGSTDGVFALLSRRLGASITPVILPFADAAVDVDKPSDLDLVRSIFEARDASTGGTAEHQNG